MSEKRTNYDLLIEKAKGIEPFANMTPEQVKDAFLNVACPLCPARDYCGSRPDWYECSNAISEWLQEEVENV